MSSGKSSRSYSFGFIACLFAGSQRANEIILGSGHSLRFERNPLIHYSWFVGQRILIRPVNGARQDLTPAHCRSGEVRSAALTHERKGRYSDRRTSSDMTLLRVLLMPWGMGLPLNRQNSVRCRLLSLLYDHPLAGRVIFGEWLHASRDAVRAPGSYG